VNQIKDGLGATAVYQGVLIGWMRAASPARHKRDYHPHIKYHSKKAFYLQ
jgi:hypothetical protein